MTTVAVGTTLRVTSPDTPEGGLDVANIHAVQLGEAGVITLRWPRRASTRLVEAYLGILRDTATAAEFSLHIPTTPPKRWRLPALVGSLRPQASEPGELTELTLLLVALPEWVA